MTALITSFNKRKQSNNIPTSTVSNNDYFWRALAGNGPVIKMVWFHFLTIRVVCEHLVEKKLLLYLWKIAMPEKGPTVFFTDYNPNVLYNLCSLHGRCKRFLLRKSAEHISLSNMNGESWEIVQLDITKKPYQYQYKTFAWAIRVP